LSQSDKYVEPAHEGKSNRHPFEALNPDLHTRKRHNNALVLPATIFYQVENMSGSPRHSGERILKSMLNIYAFGCLQQTNVKFIVHSVPKV